MNSCKHDLVVYIKGITRLEVDQNISKEIKVLVIKNINILSLEELNINIEQNL